MKSTDAERKARWARVHEAEAKAKVDIDRITQELLDSLAADPEEYEGHAKCVCGGRIVVGVSAYGDWIARCSRTGCGRACKDDAPSAARSAVSQAVNLYRLTH